MNLRTKTFLVLFLLLPAFALQDNKGQDILSPADLLALKSCRGIRLSPDGQTIGFIFGKGNEAKQVWIHLL
jgi:hypothetical protein